MTIIKVHEYISEFEQLKDYCDSLLPWIICSNTSKIVLNVSKDLGSEYVFDHDVAIHKSAIVEHGVTLKGPAIIGENCIVSANSYLRDGVFLGNEVKIGPCCEVKASLIFSQSNIAHLNYVGNSILGSHVNLEAGVVLANHFNERTQKDISILFNNTVHETNVTKFGALIGDHTKIGANSVTTPGTLFEKNSSVGRLTLVNQLEQGIK